MSDERGRKIHSIGIVCLSGLQGPCAILTLSFGAQKDINEKMRAILVDWLVEVHLKFKVRHRC